MRIVRQSHKSTSNKKVGTVIYVDFLTMLEEEPWKERILSLKGPLKAHLLQAFKN